MVKLAVFRKRFLLALVAALVFYLTSAVILSLIPTKPARTVCPGNHTVYITSNGVHLDLVVPTRLLNGELQRELKLPDRVSFVAFGWGDKEFYVNTPHWEDLKLSVALRALFINSESALHVVWIPSFQREWAGVPLCDEQVLLINQYLDHAFKRGEDGNIQEIQAAGYTDRDKFYLANGSFNGINTCNNWVNGALKHAQVRTSIWSPFDKGILYQLRKKGGNKKI